MEAAEEPLATYLRKKAFSTAVSACLVDRKVSGRREEGKRRAGEGRLTSVIYDRLPLCHRPGEYSGRQKATGRRRGCTLHHTSLCYCLEGESVLPAPAPCLCLQVHTTLSHLPHCLTGRRATYLLWPAFCTGGRTPAHCHLEGGPNQGVGVKSNARRRRNPSPGNPCAPCRAICLARAFCSGDRRGKIPLIWRCFACEAKFPGLWRSLRRKNSGVGARGTAEGGGRCAAWRLPSHLPYMNMVR